MVLDKKRYMKQWRKDNAKHIKEYTKKWNKDNPNREYMKQYKEDNREKLNKQKREYEKNKCKIDLKYHLNCRMKNAIWKSLRGNKTGNHWEDLVGYTCEDLIKRLKKTMPKNCCWQNYMEGKLHIDHIIPKSVFNFTKSGHIGFQKCWALKNLQLLPAKENISKNNKLTRPFQLAFQI